MGLGTALAIASGVKALGSYAYNRYKNNKRKKFGDSQYGRELKRIGEEGTFSQKARNIVTGSVARKSAGQAQTGKASYAGRLAAQGLEGSVAGQRGLSEFDIAKQRDVAESAREVELANEQSKVQARLSYAEQKLQDERQREALERQNTEQLIGGLGDAVSAGITAGFDAKRIRDIAKMSPQAIQSAFDSGDISLDEMLGIRQILEEQARRRTAINRGSARRTQSFVESQNV